MRILHKVLTSWNLKTQQVKPRRWQEHEERWGRRGADEWGREPESVALLLGPGALGASAGPCLEREASRRQVGKPDTCRPHVSLTCSGLHALSSMRRGRAPSPLADTVGDFSVPSPLVFHYGRTPGRLIRVNSQDATAVETHGRGATFLKLCSASGLGSSLYQ